MSCVPNYAFWICIEFCKRFTKWQTLSLKTRLRLTRFSFEHVRSSVSQPTRKFREQMELSVLRVLFCFSLPAHRIIFICMLCGPYICVNVFSMAAGEACILYTRVTRFSLVETSMRNGLTFCLASEEQETNPSLSHSWHVIAIFYCWGSSNWTESNI